MTALRGICGVIVGFVLAIAVIAACERTAIITLDVRTISVGFMLASVAWTIAGAAAGGFMAAWIAGSRGTSVGGGRRLFSGAADRGCDAAAGEYSTRLVRDGNCGLRTHLCPHRRRDSSSHEAAEN